jgi:hypothetical protein
MTSAFSLWMRAASKCRAQKLVHNLPAPSLPCSFACVFSTVDPAAPHSFFSSLCCYPSLFFCFFSFFFPFFFSPFLPSIFKGVSDCTVLAPSLAWSHLHKPVKRTGSAAARGLDLPPVFALDVSPDGRLGACGGSNGSLRVWNSVTGALRAELSGVCVGDVNVTMFFPSSQVTPNQAQVDKRNRSN